MRARQLNKDEILLLERLGNRGKVKNWQGADYRVRYRTTGNFTIAELVDIETRTRGLGVAKRNPTDKPNPTVGQQVALARAFQSV